MLLRVSDRLRPHVDRWLFRLGTPEEGTVVLRQRRIYVLPTRAGMAFGSALLAMLLASINYNLSLGYAFVFLLGGMACASIVHAFRNLHGLELTPVRNPSVFAGETAEFGFAVRNPHARRRPALQLRRGNIRSAFDASPNDTQTITVRAATQHRGWIGAGRIVIETRYPLGLIRAWSVLVPAARCLVFPAPERPAPPLPRGAGNTDTGAQTREGDDDFAGFRPHRPSDSPRHVAWKTVARGGPMLTKEFAGGAGGTLHFDWHDLPANLGTEARLSRLTAWLLMADAAGEPFVLSLPDGVPQAGQGSQHLEACLQRLAEFPHTAHSNA